LDHCAKPHIKTQEIKNWKSDIQRLAQAENIYCKVSGLVTEADIKNWKAEDFRPYLEVVFEAFGEDRVIYGSDWPVCLLAAPYEKVYGLMEEYTTVFSSEARRKFFGDNAAKIYNIQTE
jgi:L-fuconolactonase